MRRINGILDEVPEITNQGIRPVKSVIKGLIEIKDLTFFYPGKKHAALNNIDITIGAGETVALVGRVGSGKSTLLQTIPRLVETEKGMIQIEGNPVHDIDLKHLRNSIGYVTQELYIFSDTILNNITFGRKQISHEVIINALTVSQLKKDVDSFPGGINTFLGEKGVRLSGGQKQRLTIARALISNPPILILDDVLSQVDITTEAAILNSILSARQDKTNVIVSHRLSTIKQTDVIYVLKEGRVTEKGNHTTLMGLGKEYASLYERQQLSERLEGIK